MSENAIVRVGDREIKTRLHEHGLEPTCSEDRYVRSKWKESGYFDGKPEDMKVLAESGLETLEIFTGGKLKTILTGIVWGPHEETYDGHAIAHLDWKPYGDQDE